PCTRRSLPPLFPVSSLFRSRPPRRSPFPYTTLFRSAPTARRVPSGVNRSARTSALKGTLHRTLPVAASNITSHPLLPPAASMVRSEEHTSELQSPCNLVCRLLLEKKNQSRTNYVCRL